MTSIRTRLQASAGGVTFRHNGDQVEVALISVGKDRRWQLPKGMINPQEATEVGALREVREETGLTASVVKLIDKVEYWYYAYEKGERIRFHKFVYFYLMRYVSGVVTDHDFEVNEARWFEIETAIQTLSFKSEQNIVTKAKAMIEEMQL